MQWKGREIGSPGDYVHALVRVETGEEANEFRDRMMESAAIDKKIADRNIGWLTGEMSADDRDRVCALFDVKHPIAGDLAGTLTFGELLTLGGTFTEAMGGGYDFDEAAFRAQLHIRTLREVRRRTTTNGDG